MWTRKEKFQVAFIVIALIVVNLFPLTPWGHRVTVILNDWVRGAHQTQMDIYRQMR